MNCLINRPLGILSTSDQNQIATTMMKVTRTCPLSCQTAMPSKWCGAAALLFLGLSWFQLGASAIKTLHPIVLCDDSSSSSSGAQLCAYRVDSVPTPVCDVNGNCGQTKGGDSFMTTTFYFVEGVANGTDLIPEPDFFNTYTNGVTTSVQRSSSGTRCKAQVDDQYCASCTICSLGTKNSSSLSSSNLNDNIAIQVNCSNLKDGIVTDCEPILPVFYPLDKKVNASTSGETPQIMSVPATAQQEAYTTATNAASSRSNPDPVVTCTASVEVICGCAKKGSKQCAWDATGYCNLSSKEDRKKVLNEYKIFLKSCPK